MLLNFTAFCCLRKRAVCDRPQNNRKSIDLAQAIIPQVKRQLITTSVSWRSCLSTCCRIMHSLLLGCYRCIKGKDSHFDLFERPPAFMAARLSVFINFTPLLHNPLLFTANFHARFRVKTALPARQHTSKITETCCIHFSSFDMLMISARGSGCDG